MRQITLLVRLALGLKTKEVSSITTITTIIKDDVGYSITAIRTRFEN